MLARPLGTGRVHYLAGQLALADRRAFLDRLMNAYGLDRPIRAFAPGGAYLEGVEFRAVRDGQGYLAYLHSTVPEPREVKLTSKRPILDVFSVSAGTKQGAKMTLAPLETRILRIKLK